jgi:hypothetical protein
MPAGARRTFKRGRRDNASGTKQDRGDQAPSALRIEACSGPDCGAHPALRFSLHDLERG